MGFPGSRRLVTVLVAVLLAAAPVAVLAQQASDGEQKGAEQPKNNGEAAKAEQAQQQRVNEIAEASRLLSGPAGNPECVWLGRRVVGLLWRDDLDTAFRHIDLYDRFGCPGNHIQATFRCLVSRGNFDPKAAESLNARVHSCWINPGPPTAPAAATTPPAPAVQAGETKATKAR